MEKNDLTHKLQEAVQTVVSAINQRLVGRTSPKY